MNMFDEARSLKCVLETRKMTQRELGQSLGVSTSYVANKLRLLNLSEDLEKLIITSRVSERHARALLRLDSEDERRVLLDRIINEGLTVARTEALADISTMRAFPAAIAQSDKKDAAATFIEGIKNAARALSSVGIEAKIIERHYESKLYLTAIIDE